MKIKLFVKESKRKNKDAPSIISVLGFQSRALLAITFVSVANALGVLGIKQYCMQYIVHIKYTFARSSVRYVRVCVCVCRFCRKEKTFVAQNKFLFKLTHNRLCMIFHNHELVNFLQHQQQNSSRTYRKLLNSYAHHSEASMTNILTVTR